MNEFLVSMQGDKLTMLAPPQRGQLLERERALKLAAWIVTILDPDQVEFQTHIDSVQS